MKRKTLICKLAVQHVLQDLECQGKDSWTLYELIKLFTELFSQVEDKFEDNTIQMESIN